MSFKKSLKNNKDFEICINCGRVTDVSKNMNVSCRKHYVLGLGQLCEDCYEKLTATNAPR